MADRLKQSLACLPAHPTHHPRWYNGTTCLPPLPCRYVVLAPRDSDQITLLATTEADRKLEELPLYRDLLKKFSSKEVGGRAAERGAATFPCEAAALRCAAGACHAPPPGSCQPLCLPSPATSCPALLPPACRCCGGSMWRASMGLRWRRRQRCLEGRRARGGRRVSMGTGWLGGWLRWRLGWQGGAWAVWGGPLEGPLPLHSGLLPCQTPAGALEKCLLTSPCPQTSSCGSSSTTCRPVLRLVLCRLLCTLSLLLPPLLSPQPSLTRLQPSSLLPIPPTLPTLPIRHPCAGDWRLLCPHHPAAAGTDAGPDTGRGECVCMWWVGMCGGARVCAVGCEPQWWEEAEGVMLEGSARSAGGEARRLAAGPASTQVAQQAPPPPCGIPWPAPCEPAGREAPV